MARLLFIALLNILPWALAQEANYTVRAGDTLMGIAWQFDMTVAELKQLNALSSDLIRVGQRLRLSTEQADEAVLQPYTVSSQDSLTGLAERYQIEVALIKELNPGLGDTLTEGMKLRLPSKPGRTITMVAGDSLLSLALQNGLSPEELTRVNGLNDLGAASPGLVLFIPERTATDNTAVLTALSSSAQPRERLLSQQRSLMNNVVEQLSRYEPPGPEYLWPLTVKGRISSPYGRRNLSVAGNTFHAGLDIAVPSGMPILATRGGVVSRAAWGGTYGYVVYVDHPDGSQTRYAHMSRILVEPGQFVSQGENLGLVGNTGASTGPHLHFELRFNGRAVDPIAYLPQ